MLPGDHLSCERAERNTWTHYCFWNPEYREFSGFLFIYQVTVEFWHVAVRISQNATNKQTSVLKYKHIFIWKLQIKTYNLGDDKTNLSPHRNTFLKLTFFPPNLILSHLATDKSNSKSRKGSLYTESVISENNHTSAGTQAHRCPCKKKLME